MSGVTRDDVKFWGRTELLRVMPYTNAFRNMGLEQLRDMAWLEIQKQQIEDADSAKNQLSAV